MILYNSKIETRIYRHDKHREDKIEIFHASCLSPVISKRQSALGTLISV